jgi:hypothetical protein
MKKIELLKWSLIDSVAVLAYIFLVVLFMRHAEKIFGKVDTILTGVAVLSLFVLSAAVTSALVLGRPVLFYLDGLKKEAIKLFCLTVGWLFVFLVITMTISYFIK